MTSKVTKNDRELLTSIAEHKALTVNQLSALSQRSSQVVRRRMRTLAMEDLIITKMHGFGRDRGRPEDLILLTEKGAALLVDEGIPSGYAVARTRRKILFPLTTFYLLTGSAFISSKSKETSPNCPSNTLTQTHTLWLGTGGIVLQS